MDGYVSIKDIRAGQKNINVVFIVLEVSHATITKENREVRTLKVADSTACMNVSIWDEPGQLLMPGDIVRLTKGYASIWRQCLTLYSGKTGDIQKIGEFCMVINEQVNMSEPNPLLSQQLGVNQSGSGPPGSNVNNSITNNGNANSISGQPGRQSLAIQSNTTTGSGVTTGSTTVKSGNGGGGNGGNVGSGGGSSSGGGNGGGGNGGNGGGGSSSGSSGVSGSSVRYSSSDSTTKSAPTTKSNSRGRGSYRNGGRNDRR